MKEPILRRFTPGRPLVAWIKTEYSIRRHEWVGWLFLSIPASIREFSEFSRRMSPWHVTAFNFTFFESLTLLFRTPCLHASSQRLNRPE